jgi:hypothetical protein
MSSRVTPAEESTHISVDPSRVRDVTAVDYITRFVFGAMISVVAGILGMHFGYRIGGLFLAFPAILPASLTLIEKKEGPRSADFDAMGAVMGAIGMVAFAVVSATTIGRLNVFVGIGLAALAWVAVSMGLYLLVSKLGLRPLVVPFIRGRPGARASKAT